MTNKTCTCRSIPRERYLDRDCPVHGDAEEQRRHKLAAAFDEIQRALAADKPVTEDQLARFLKNLTPKQYDETIRIIRIHLEAAELERVDPDVAAELRAYAWEGRRHA